MAVTLAHVHRYIELGFVIHPLCPSDHMCQSPGKIPFDAVEGGHMPGWQDHPQFSVDQWGRWLDYDSSINLGMLTGQRSRLIGIDIDDEPGEEYVSELWDGKTWEYTTGKGRRLLFRSDEPTRTIRIRDGLGRSFEVLADGKNNVLPPSEHASGRSYAWTPGLTPKEILEPAQLPEWAKVAPVSADCDGINSDEIDWVPIIMNRNTAGQRNDVMPQIAGRLIGPAPLTKKEAYLICLMINQRYGKPPLQDCEIKSIVKSIGRAEDRARKSEGKEIAHVMSNPNSAIPRHLAVEIARGRR